MGRENSIKAVEAGASTISQITVIEDMSVLPYWSRLIMRSPLILIKDISAKIQYKVLDE